MNLTTDKTKIENTHVLNQDKAAWWEGVLTSVFLPIFVYSHQHLRLIYILNLRKNSKINKSYTHYVQVNSFKTDVYFGRVYKPVNSTDRKFRYLVSGIHTNCIGHRQFSWYVSWDIDYRAHKYTIRFWVGSC